MPIEVHNSVGHPLLIIFSLIKMQPSPPSFSSLGVLSLSLKVCSNECSRFRLVKNHSDPSQGHITEVLLGHYLFMILQGRANL